MSDRYARQILFYGIGDRGQKILMEKSVVLIGCDALGCASANLLVRSGIKRLHIIDRDFIEEHNLQRQTLFDEEDIEKNLPKAIAAQRKLRKVNSQIRIDSTVADINPSNIQTLIGNADIIIDGTDNFQTRFLINDYSVKKGIPWIYGACIGSVGLTMNIIPGKTPCLRCILENIPPPGTIETCDTAGIIAPVASIVASFQVTEAIKILTENYHALNKGLLEADVWRNMVRYVPADTVTNKTDCIVCCRHHYEFLTQGKHPETTSLCGRSAVQILHTYASEIDLTKLAIRLERAGAVSYNNFMLRLNLGTYELAVFPDGRAIISGTNDVSVAKGLYAKYIGM